MTNLEYIGAEKYEVSNEKNEKIELSVEELKKIFKIFEKSETFFSEKNENQKSLFD